MSKPGIQVDSNVDQFGVTYPFPRQFGDHPWSSFEKLIQWTCYYLECDPTYGCPCMTICVSMWKLGLV